MVDSVRKRTELAIPVIPSALFTGCCAHFVLLHMKVKVANVEHPVHIDTASMYGNYRLDKYAVFCAIVTKK